MVIWRVKPRSKPSSRVFIHINFLRRQESFFKILGLPRKGVRLSAKSFVLSTLVHSKRNFNTKQKDKFILSAVEGLQSLTHYQQLLVN